MTASSPRERLLRRSEEAALRLRRAQQAQRRTEAPGPGDLFLFPETDELQWAVLEQDPEGRLRAVAADPYPAIGSADVAVPPRSACGALSLRCRFDVRLPAEHFQHERRTGSLEPAVLERARRKLLALDEGRPVGTLSELETDREPEYLDLVKELELARAALRERRETVKRPADGVEPARRPAGRWGSTSGFFALAAMILLAVSLALVAGLLDQIRRREQPLIDPPHVSLSPREGVRGPVETLVLPRAATDVLLILEVTDPEPYQGYRLEMQGKDSDTTVFSEELARTGITEVPVLLPRRLLSAGDYVLRLYGQRDGEAAAPPGGTEGRTELVEEYDLSLALE